MHRLVLLLLPLIALLGLAGPADAATTTTTRTLTYGPYNGAARPGYDPDAVRDGEAYSVSCQGDDVAVGGSARIVLKTSHGTSPKVLRITKQNYGFDAESGQSQYRAFVEPTGKPGWNSITLTVICRKG